MAQQTLLKQEERLVKLIVNTHVFLEIETSRHPKLNEIEKSDTVHPKPSVIGTINIPGVPIAADEKNKAKKANKAINQL